MKFGPESTFDEQIVDGSVGGEDGVGRSRRNRLDQDGVGVVCVDNEEVCVLVIRLQTTRLTRPTQVGTTSATPL